MIKHNYNTESPFSSERAARRHALFEHFFLRLIGDHLKGDSSGPELILRESEKYAQRAHEVADALEQAESCGLDSLR